MENNRNYIEGEIAALKILLADTDYKCLKYAEGAISAKEYSETKALRLGWRERINELEVALVEVEEAERLAMEAEAAKTAEEAETPAEAADYSDISEGDSASETDDTAPESESAATTGDASNVPDAVEPDTDSVEPGTTE